MPGEGCVTALWTMLINWLDHWQSLAAGLVAIVAALLAVFGTEFFAQRKERREIEGIRVALAVEARGLMDTMIATHAALVDMLSIPCRRSPGCEARKGAGSGESGQINRAVARRVAKAGGLPRLRGRDRNARETTR